MQIHQLTNLPPRFAHAQEVVGSSERSVCALTWPPVRARAGGGGKHHGPPHGPHKPPVRARAGGGGTNYPRAGNLKRGPRSIRMTAPAAPARSRGAAPGIRRSRTPTTSPRGGSGTSGTGTGRTRQDPAGPGRTRQDPAATAPPRREWPASKSKPNESPKAAPESIAYYLFLSRFGFISVRFGAFRCISPTVRESPQSLYL